MNAGPPSLNQGPPPFVGQASNGPEPPQLRQAPTPTQPIKYPQQTLQQQAVQPPLNQMPPRPMPTLNANPVGVPPMPGQHLQQPGQHPQQPGIIPGPQQPTFGGNQPPMPPMPSMPPMQQYSQVNRFISCY